MSEPRNPANREQIQALQALYAKWEAHGLPAADSRAARLEWASENVGRQIASFNDLSRDEARALIDALKGALGQPLKQQPHAWRRIRSRERAQAAGTAGRHGVSSSVIQMASLDDQARIDEAIRRLGWTREGYETWLRSSSSPLHGMSAAAVLTVGEANKVWWALKAMLRRSGRWHPGHIRDRFNGTGGGARRGG
jgi:hypothetical protein